MFEKSDSPNRQKMNSCSFMKFYGKISIVLVLTQQNAFLNGFILKTTERAQVLLKIGIRDF